MTENAVAIPQRTFVPLYLVLGWLVPGLGHFLLRRRARGVVFLALVLFSTAVGYSLQGHLFRHQAGQPLESLGMLASMGSGLVDAVLRYGLDYLGTPEAPGYEYGTAFLLTAGLMNLLLLLDVWDIASGRKE